MSTRYIHTTDCAKLIRQALKRNFPSITFSVTSKKYSGGSSINVGWMDGPTSEAVDKIAGSYAGGRFDGMIDMAYSVSHYLLPDGSAVLASSPGSVGSAGSDPAYKAPAMPQGAEEVNFCVNYVFCNRSYSASFLRGGVEAVAAKFGGFDPATIEIEEWRTGGGAHIKDHSTQVAGEWLSTMVHREMVHRAGGG